MKPTISSEMELWKIYSEKRQRYILKRSCVYGYPPGPQTPSEDDPLSRLAVKILVYELKSDGEEPVGEISITISANTWNEMANLDNETEADYQLRRGLHLARSGRWGVEPLMKMLNQGFEEIKSQIDNHENNGASISGDFSLQIP